MSVLGPITLLWGNLTVLMDGNPTVEPIRKDNGTHTSLCFTYELQGAKNVQVNGTEAAPEFPSLITISLVAVFVTVTILAAVLTKKKRNR